MATALIYVVVLRSEFADVMEFEVTEPRSKLLQFHSVFELDLLFPRLKGESASLGPHPIRTCDTCDPSDLLIDLLHQKSSVFDIPTPFGFLLNTTTTSLSISFHYGYL